MERMERDGVMRMRFSWSGFRVKWDFKNSGVESRVRHVFAKHLHLPTDFAGSRENMSIKISWGRSDFAISIQFGAEFFKN